MVIDTHMHIVSSITGDRIDSCTFGAFGAFGGTNYVPGKARNQLWQYLGVPMRCGMDPAILSGVTMHASSSESVWRGKPTWKSSQFPLLSGSRYGGGVVGTIVPVPGGDNSITPLCEIISPHI